MDVAQLREIPKIDPHHHLWDLDNNDYPWLQGPVQPRMYGDYGAMCKNYLIADYLRDISPHNVVRSVHVQANWNQNDPVGETRWCQAIADTHGFPHGIVAHANLAAEDVEEVVLAHRAFSNVRGIRHIMGHTDDPELARTDRPDYLNDTSWELGYALLAKHDLSFDLQAFPGQLLNAAAIARRHPNVMMIVCHTGFPWDRSEAGVAQWRQGMASLAELPHVYAKLSGPGMVMVDWTVETFAPFIHETIDLFGPERCMFASNVPPDALHKSYDQIYEGFYQWVSRYSEHEQRLMFHDTAANVYRV